MSFEISKLGATVVGMDLSDRMVDHAKEKYPELDFVTGNAEAFKFEEDFDAVFSNAALHWIKNSDNVVRNVRNVLKKGGRFVAEFGGKGNVEKIVAGISNILSKDYGMDANKLSPWYFPSIGEYSSLLEQHGFRVSYAVHFDRPTKLEDGENGLYVWLAGLAADEFFKGFNASEKKHVFDKAAALVKQDLYQDGFWYADYKRLRIIAHKYG